MKNRKSLFAMCCIMTTLLASCSSGTKGSTGALGTTGVFADAPVVGLTYACGTQTGVTGTGGTFTCPGGSTVTFSVGGITLCTEPAQPFMTPLSCAQATDPSANTSTPSVLAVAQFVLSISTTPASSGVLTITPNELQAAAGLTLNFSTATDAQLLAAVDAINPGAPLIDATTAENELISTVDTALAGNYAGTYSGGSSGTWTVTIASNGSVSGTSTDSKGNVTTVSGSLVTGITYSGSADSASWTGTVDTSKTPDVFSGTWTNPAESANGTFTGTKQ